ncbi:hypothetical protein FRC09_020919 [Ceratobasidium sp. 395]|nr:hypothetical protein FRC09_020919 [Ceratobasidium sp. 395]
MDTGNEEPTNVPLPSRRRRKKKHKKKRKRKQEDEGTGDPNLAQRRTKADKFKEAEPTSHAEHAANVLASVGEAGPSRVNVPDTGGEGDDQGDGGEDEAYHVNGSDRARPRSSDTEMDTQSNSDSGSGEEEEAGDEETSIVESLYDEENGKGDDALYVKILKLVEVLTKEHKLLHKKISDLSDRLDRKLQADSDVEMAGPSSKKDPSQRKKKKKQATKWEQDIPYERPAGRRTRDPTRILILAYIRQVLLALLGRKSRKELLPDGPPDNIAAPSETMFYIKWDESEKSAFNRVAANIVTTHVMKEWPESCPEDERDNIFDMAIKHIRYLKKLYKRQRLPDGDPNELARRLHCSADTRMRTLFEQRLKVVDTIPGLQHHRQLIVELGVEGTSSDEEDPNNPGHYLVKRRKELSTNVRELKSKVDLVYKHRYKAAGSRGSQVRKRVASGQVSKRPFKIKNLPRSVMSRQWLSTLTEDQVAWFEFNDYQYVFAFPDEMLNPM